MKKIRNISDRPVIINYVTLFPEMETDQIDEGLLDSDEIKTLLETGKIEVIDETAPPGTDAP